MVFTIFKKNFCPVKSVHIILQGLGVAQAAVTERWPQKEQKRPKISFFLIPRSGSKAEDGKEEREREKKVGDNNGQATHDARKGACKPPGPKPNINYFLANTGLIFNYLLHPDITACLRE